MNKFYLKSLAISQLIGILIWLLVTSWPAQAQKPQYLHTEGHRIMDANGNQVILTGLNWFGLETESFAPHGLWARSLDSILDQIVDLGFNTIRLPYSNQLFDPSSTPNGINYDLNPDLEGLSGLEIMDKIVTGAGERGLKVILDRHRPDSHAQSELWYTSQYDEERWIRDWVMLAKRYSGNDTVIGMDLHNEPHGQATWGSDDPATDWRLAAELAGNAILEANPSLLIIVQGVEQVQDDWYWWGGNLIGAREQPVRLNIEDRLVYSTHVYGPGVYPQPWFSEPDFPDNMPEIWDRHWGYLHKEDIAPVIVGEFGGRSVGDDQEGIWQRALVSYLRENNISYIYWTLNPNSGDTGGILLDDWQSVDPGKEELLSGYQFPLIGIEQIGPDPAARLASPEPTPVSTEQPATSQPPASVELSVRYRNANPVQISRDSKPEFIIANLGSTPASLDSVDLLYWLNDDHDQPFVFHCDWAQIGCANVLGEFLVSQEGNRYLRIHFSKGLEPLQPGEDTGEIKVRFNRTDWSEFRQDDDYSFSTVGEYEDWERGALAVNGQIIWGSLPGTTPAARLPGTVTPMPATPTTQASSLPVTPLVTGGEVGLSTDVALASMTPTPLGNYPYSPPGRFWQMWAVPAVAIIAAFAAGFLVAAIWLGRKKR